MTVKEVKNIVKDVRMYGQVCRVCGSENIYCIQETHLIDKSWAIVHTAYCEKCAKDLEQYELQLRKQRVKE